MNSYSTTPTSTSPDAQPASPPNESANQSQPMKLPKLQDLALVIGMVLLLVLTVYYIFFYGRVSTDDAQVDCHITAIPSRVPGYVVQLMINDNSSVYAAGMGVGGLLTMLALIPRWGGPPYHQFWSLPDGRHPGCEYLFVRPHTC